MTHAGLIEIAVLCPELEAVFTGLNQIDNYMPSLFQLSVSKIVSSSLQYMYAMRGNEISIAAH